MRHHQAVAVAQGGVETAKSPARASQGPHKTIFGPHESDWRGRRKGLLRLHLRTLRLRAKIARGHARTGQTRAGVLSRGVIAVDRERGGAGGAAKVRDEHGGHPMGTRQK